jgi:hypothetical protein
MSSVLNFEMWHKHYTPYHESNNTSVMLFTSTSIWCYD